MTPVLTIYIAQQHHLFAIRIEQSKRFSKQNRMRGKCLEKVLDFILLLKSLDISTTKVSHSVNHQLQTQPTGA